MSESNESNESNKNNKSNKSKLQDRWQGRIDGDATSVRWHQRVNFEEAENYQNHLVIAGFASDEGVRRNKGRVGARLGPEVIRKALANLSCDTHFRFYDLGDVECMGEQLEAAQSTMASKVASILNKQGFPFILGGGHEIAISSFSALLEHFRQRGVSQPRLGIINFDAHFDLRDPSGGANSGTPFRQCQALCQAQGMDFNYLVLGLNASSNTQNLFDFAQEHGVSWLSDEDMHSIKAEEKMHLLKTFLQKCDYLYISICLDVFNAAFAPGVSAPAALGIYPIQALQWLRLIFHTCQELNVKPVLCDIAEMNPKFDSDNQTAKLAARLVYHIQSLRQ